MTKIKTKKPAKLPLPFRVFRASVPVIELFLPFVAKRLAIKAFFFPYRYKLPEKEIRLANKAKSDAVILNNLQLRTYEWGDGPTVLVMHGWSSRTTQFIYFVDALVLAGFRVIGVDAPGHGYSEGSRSDVLQFGESILALVKQKGEIDYILGHSMGGSALVYAIGKGLKAKKMGLIATPTVADDILEISRVRMNASVKTRDGLRKEIVKRYNRDLDNFTAAKMAEGLEMPATLLIYDKNDDDVPAYHGKVVQKAIPGSELIYTENLGHTRILKDPKTIELILNWFQS